MCRRLPGSPLTDPVLPVPTRFRSFRILAEARGAWLDLGGSGNETHAHLAADGRITLMFCAFDRPAWILRSYGRGRPVLPQDAEWDAVAAPFAQIGRAHV